MTAKRVASGEYVPLKGIIVTDSSVNFIASGRAKNPSSLLRRLLGFGEQSKPKVVKKKASKLAWNGESSSHFRQVFRELGWQFGRYNMAATAYEVNRAFAKEKFNFKDAIPARAFKQMAVAFRAGFKQGKRFAVSRRLSR